MQSSSQAWKMWQPEDMEIELCLKLHCLAHLWKERHRKDYSIKACRSAWHALMARDWLHVNSSRRLETWKKRMACSRCWLEPKPPIILMIMVFMLLFLCCYSRRWRWWWLCSWNCSLCSWEEQKSADDEKEGENGKLRSISECTRKEFKAFRGNDSFGFSSFPCSAIKFGRRASIPRKGWGSSISGSFSRSSLVPRVSPLVSLGSLLFLSFPWQSYSEGQMMIWIMIICINGIIVIARQHSAKAWCRYFALLQICLPYHFLFWDLISFSCCKLLSSSRQKYTESMLQVWQYVFDTVVLGNLIRITLSNIDDGADSPKGDGHEVLTWLTLFIQKKSGSFILERILVCWREGSKRELSSFHSRKHGHHQSSIHEFDPSIDERAGLMNCLSVNPTFFNIEIDIF